MNDASHRIPGRRPRGSVRVALAVVLMLVFPPATDTFAAGCGMGGGDGRAGCCAKCGGKGAGREAAGPRNGPGSGHVADVAARARAARGTPTAITR